MPGGPFSTPTEVMARGCTGSPSLAPVIQFHDTHGRAHLYCRPVDPLLFSDWPSFTGEAWSICAHGRHRSAAGFLSFPHRAAVPACRAANDEMRNRVTIPGDKLNRSWTSTLMTVGTIVTLALTTGPASAAPAPRADGTTQALAPCLAEAKAVKAAAWVCTPAGLTTFDDHGRSTFTAVSPSVAPRTTVASGTSRLADDYDYWCENGSICHRKVSTYIEETKGNAAYGDLRGVIGTFDVVLRTNLNGRQAQWRVSLIWDSGPGLSFDPVGVLCYEEINNLPDNNCGVHPAGTARIHGGSWRWDSSTIYGNRLNNSNEYYGTATGSFRADGYSLVFTMGALESSYFYCYGTARCRF